MAQNAKELREVGGPEDVGPQRPRVQLGPGALVPNTRYRIISWLGDGGMGVVYEAAHTDLDRRVALKVLHAEHSQDPETLETFREEARTTSALGSAQIVDVFDFAELPDGRLVYMMELLEGYPLSAEVEGGRVDAARLIGILRQICQGLAVAHDAGVIHRDIKPDNIMLLTARGGRPDAIKITDFGTAALTGIAGAAEGTPAYMPPEQIRRLSVAPATDAYALGCTAYELASGRQPFPSRSLKEVLRAHLKQPAPRLTPQDDIPEPLAAVIARCLEKEPAQRYPDMRELEAALCEAQIEAGITTLWDDLPVPEVEPERRDRIISQMPDPTRERRRSWVLPAILGGVIASLGVGAVAIFLPPPPEQRNEIDLLAEEARDAAARARFVYPPADSPDSPTAYAKVQQLRTLGASEAQERADLLRLEFAETLATLGDQYWEAEGGRPFATDYYIQALLFDPANERAAQRGTITPGQFAAFQERATQSQFSAAELVAAEPLAALADPDEKARHKRLGVLKRSQSAVASARIDKLLDKPKRKVTRPETAVRPQPQAEPQTPSPPPVQVVQAVPAPKQPDLTESKRDPAKAREFAKAGHASLEAGKWAVAEKRFHQALSLDRRSASALSGLSDVHFERGQFRKAIDYARKAIRVAPRRARYHIQLGDAFYNVLRYADAKAEYERAHKLGGRDAQQRLNRVKAKLGE